MHGRLRQSEIPGDLGRGPPGTRKASNFAAEGEIVHEPSMPIGYDNLVPPAGFEPALYGF
jgi:hypothetical protein